MMTANVILRIQVSSCVRNPDTPRDIELRPIKLLQKLVFGVKLSPGN